MDVWTIWLTANGATGRPGLAALKSASSVAMRVSHFDNSSAGRALSAGNDPTMPAWHCAMTSSGPLAMNIGAPMTGRDRC